MNYHVNEFTPQHDSNPYAQTYRFSKLPNSVFQPTPTPSKPTLIRNQSFQNRLYNEDLIQLIAKIRCLEDDLINERFKNQSLQRKVNQYEKIINNLQYELTQQSYQLQKYLHEIELSNQKNLQILKYQQNLKIVGEQIEQLNNILVKKNREFDLIGQQNRHLEKQIKRLEEDCYAFKMNQNICKNNLDNLYEQHLNFLQTLKDQSNRLFCPVIQSLNGINLSNSSLPAKIPVNNRLNMDDFDLGEISQEIFKKISNLSGILNQIMINLKNRDSEHEKTKNQLVFNLLKEKQRFIKLEYDFKLLEERLKDNHKKQDLIFSYYNQQKTEQMMAQLMQKEDDYIKRIDQITSENQNLREQIAIMQENHHYFQQVDLQEKNSVISNLKQENFLLESTVAQLTTKLKSVELKYETIMAEKFEGIQQQSENSMKLAKKGRKIEQENYEYKIKIQELMGQISMLQKQIIILKRQQPQYAEKN